MREECMVTLRKYITAALIKNAGDPSFNVFDGLIELLQTNWDSSPTTIAELKKAKKTKEKGDLFEHFALLYFSYLYSAKGKGKKEGAEGEEAEREVYLLADAPEELLEKLGLKRNDLGIDLLVGSSNGSGSGNEKEWCAVQVKYRKPLRNKKTVGVSWADLSTFYALTSRSGPFCKHVVFTNANYVRHVGRKDKKDQSICIGTLRNITRDDWRLMAGIFVSGFSLSCSASSFSSSFFGEGERKETADEKKENPSKEELRRLRCSFYDKLVQAEEKKEKEEAKEEKEAAKEEKEAAKEEKEAAKEGKKAAKELYSLKSHHANEEPSAA